MSKEIDCSSPTELGSLATEEAIPQCELSVRMEQHVAGAPTLPGLGRQARALCCQCLCVGDLWVCTEPTEKRNV